MYTDANISLQKKISGVPPSERRKVMHPGFVEIPPPYHSSTMKRKGWGYQGDGKSYELHKRYSH